jgi:hypothetical protein
MFSEFSDILDQQHEKELYVARKCPYCGGSVKFGYFEHQQGVLLQCKLGDPYYVCGNYDSRGCDAYVSAHVRSRSKNLKPMGTLANRSLRRLRQKCHDVFDLLWKEKFMTRTKAYRVLARLMNKRRKDAHIAMFSETDCELLLELFTGLEFWEMYVFESDPYKVHAIKTPEVKQVVYVEPHGSLSFLKRSPKEACDHLKSKGISYKWTRHDPFQRVA